MTPKEKAKELFDKYQRAGSQYYIDTTKKYALILVDEILELFKNESLIPHLMNLMNEKYWLEVKNEIEKL